MNEHPLDSPRWAPRLIPAQSRKQSTRTPNFRSKTLIIRELDLPFETAPKNTRESTRTRSRRARRPSRVIRVRRGNGRKTNVVHFNFRGSGAAAARPPCLLLGGSSPFRSRRTCSSIYSAKSYRASQLSWDHPGEASVAKERVL